jgi:hypothetical protein
VENLALRQQLATLAVRRRPSLRPVDRAFWVILRRVWAPWRSVLVIVEPDTVVRWHRAGFRLDWAWLSRRRTAGRPRLADEVRTLVRRMATETSWGAPRIHGELLRLGLVVSERSVSRFLSRLPRPRHRGPSWTTFLRAHRDAIAAMDLLTVPTTTFRLLYVLVVVHHGRREAVHCAVTDRPQGAEALKRRARIGSDAHAWATEAHATRARREVERLRVRRGTLRIRTRRPRGAAGGLSGSIAPRRLRFRAPRSRDASRPNSDLVSLTASE